MYKVPEYFHNSKSSCTRKLELFSNKIGYLRRIRKNISMFCSYHLVASFLINFLYKIFSKNRPRILMIYIIIMFFLF